MGLCLHVLVNKWDFLHYVRICMARRKLGKCNDGAKSDENRPNTPTNLTLFLLSRVATEYNSRFSGARTCDLVNKVAHLLMS